MSVRDVEIHRDFVFEDCTVEADVDVDGSVTVTAIRIGGVKVTKDNPIWPVLIRNLEDAGFSSDAQNRAGLVLDGPFGGWRGARFAEGFI